MTDCIFCKIARHEVPATVVIETEKVISFIDTNKNAPEHILVIPKEHIESLNDVNTDHQAILGELLLVAKEIAQQRGIDQTGYRCVINTKKDAGQVVNHLHCHVLGGASLGPIVNTLVKPTTI